MDERRGGFTVYGQERFFLQFLQAARHSRTQVDDPLEVFGVERPGDDGFGGVADHGVHLVDVCQIFLHVTDHDQGHDKVHMLQPVGQSGCDGRVVFLGGPAFACVDIKEVRACGAGTHIGIASAYMHGGISFPVIHFDHGWGRGYAFLDQVRGDFYCITIYGTTVVCIILFGFL